MFSLDKAVHSESLNFFLSIRMDLSICLNSHHLKVEWSTAYSWNFIHASDNDGKDCNSHWKILWQAICFREQY